MSAIKTLVRIWSKENRAGAGLAAGLLAGLLLLLPSEAQAARNGGFGGRTSVGRVSVLSSRGVGMRVVAVSGLGFSRFGGGWGSRYCWYGSVAYPDVISPDPSASGNVVWPSNYEKNPQNKFTIVVVAPPDSTPTEGPTGQMVYDAKGNAVGVVLRNADGSPQFVPVSP